MGELELHQGIPNKKKDLHLNAMYRSMKRWLMRPCKSDMLKMVNHGVRALNLLDKDVKPDYVFDLGERVTGFIGMLTPRELMQIFPVSKSYDGEKWQMKDYYSTMKELQIYGLDRRILGNAEEVLGEYMNSVLMKFQVRIFCAASDLQRQKTGVGLMEQWCSENKIPVYNMCKDPDTGKEFIFDSATGKTSPVKRALPKGWNIVS